MRASIDARIQKGLDAEFELGESSVIESAKTQLNEYFSQQRTSFDLPLFLVGAPFQKRVWDALLKIPFGETETYLGLAQNLGDEKAIRAVAAANGANAISIIVPCHRIVGSAGELVGYAGGLPAKQKLLELEGIHFPAEQLQLFK